MLVAVTMCSAALLSLALVAGCGAPSPRARGGPPDPLDTISPEELYSRGVTLGRAGDFVRAEQYIAAAVERGFPEDQALPALLAACVQASRLSAALNYAEPYLARNPTQWSLRLLVASIHMGLAQHGRARTELERVLRDAPEEPPEAHYFLGVLFRDDLADAGSAEGHFRRYLALAPEGTHRDEAIAALPDEERAAFGVPVRVRGDASGGPVRMAPESEDGASP